MQTKLEDRVEGVIYGQAIGDALGLGMEGLSKTQVRQYYPNGLRHYGQIVRDAHRRRWDCGAWTDDTDQMLCILDSLLEREELDPLDIADRLYQWATRGGMGIGRTVRAVLYSPGFLQDPHAVARQMWESYGRNAAANGGVMRTSILGVWQYHDPGRVRHNAEQVCRLTHYDPRCVGSCVAVCLAISALLRDHEDVAALVREVAKETSVYDDRMREYFDKAMDDNLAALDLDGTCSGYTLKAMAAGLWALQYADSYEQGILKVIHEGGDADSNAAVAGALLGAKFGFSQIPGQWIDGLAHGRDLRDRADRLLRIIDRFQS